jgi:hypothetical protein
MRWRLASVRHSLRFGVLVALIALILSACGGGADGGGEHQQAKGRPLPKYEQASLPAGQYHTTEFEPSLSFRITGDDWRFEGPSGTLGDPEHPDYLFFQRVPEGEIAFFNLRKLKGVYKPKGQNRPIASGSGEIGPVPAPDELVGWFQHHPALKTSEPEPATVGGFKGVQFDVVTANLLKDDCCVDIFALSTGGPSEVIHFATQHFIVLKDVKGVPVVIQYKDEKDHFDKFVPVAEKVLQSVKWTDT